MHTWVICPRYMSPTRDVVGVYGGSMMEGSLDSNFQQLSLKRTKMLSSVVSMCLESGIDATRTC